MHDTYHRRNRFIKKFLIKVITEKNLSSLETGMTFFLHILIVFSTSTILFIMKNDVLWKYLSNVIQREIKKGKKTKVMNKIVTESRKWYPQFKLRLTFTRIWCYIFLGRRSLNRISMILTKTRNNLQHLQQQTGS